MSLLGHCFVRVELSILVVVPKEVDRCRNSGICCVLLCPTNEGVAFITEGVSRLDHNTGIVRNVITCNGVFSTLIVLVCVLVCASISSIVRIPRNMRIGRMLTFYIFRTKLNGIVCGKQD